MPIYAYRCAQCGHAKDVLQKLSDPVLSTCPSCGAQAFQKQLTAAGFQLKGSGWYVTDFRGGSKSAGSSATTPGAAEPAAAGGAGTSTPASDTTPAAASGGACASSCACH
jgi:putative FmdB family regulatory protein